MSDVNFLARRARLLGRQLSESWMVSAGGLLNELADALEAKAGAEAAGEAVAASQADGWGVGGVEGAQGRLEGAAAAAWWGQRSVDADNDRLLKELEDFGVIKRGVTWFVEGRGVMTPQQMADALVEVDRRVAELRAEAGEAWGRCEDRQKEAKVLRQRNGALRAELVKTQRLVSEVSKQADLWRVEADRFREEAADFRREADGRKEGCEEIGRRLESSRATSAQLAKCNETLRQEHAAKIQSLGFELELAKKQLELTRQMNFMKATEPVDHAGSLRREGWIVVKPDDVTAAVKTMLWHGVPNWFQWKVEEGAKMVVDSLLKTSQS